MNFNDVLNWCLSYGVLILAIVLCGSRSDLRRTPLYIFSCGAVGAITLGSLLGINSRIVFNTTDSLPGYVYYLSKDDSPRWGKVIAFKAPKTSMLKMPFLKIVRGLPGQLVSSSGEDVYLDQELVAKAKTHSKKGRALKAIQSRVIPKDSYFVWSPHEDSYDSRYEEVGLVKRDQIVGVATRVL